MLIREILFTLEICEELLHILLAHFFITNGARVNDTELHRLHKVRLLTQVRHNTLIVVLYFIKNSRVGLKRNDGSLMLCGTNLLHFCLWLSNVVFLDMVSSVAMHFRNDVC